VLPFTSSATVIELMGNTPILVKGSDVAVVDDRKSLWIHFSPLRAGFHAWRLM
jgi:hypothetical protein